MPATIVALVEDLFFLAKIRETAKAIGATVLSVDLRQGAPGIAKARPQAIILDLNLRAEAALEWIRALKAEPGTQTIPIIGFVSHVQEQLIADARGAGCDTVMARSAFTKQLPTLLTSLFLNSNAEKLPTSVQIE